MLEIKAALTEHAGLLAEFSERTFRETFAPHNSAADMAIYIEKTFGKEKQRREIADPQNRLMLAFNDGDLIGYYKLIADSRDPSVQGPRPIQLSRLYVDARWHGQKVAHRLMRHVIDKSRQEGFATLWLGVWEKNWRALAFYKKWGFKEVGFVDFYLGNDLQRDFIFSRSLEASSRLTLSME